MLGAALTTALATAADCQPGSAAALQPWDRGPLPRTRPKVQLTLAPGVLVLVLVPVPGGDEAEPTPAPLLTPPRWHALARCRQAGLSAFFGGDDTGGRPTLRPTVLAAARRLCDSCPVERLCLVHALTEPEHYGVWAGTSGRQREALIARVASGESAKEVVEQWLARP